MRPDELAERTPIDARHVGHRHVDERALQHLDRHEPAGARSAKRERHPHEAPTRTAEPTLSGRETGSSVDRHGDSLPR